ncbi:hypothetical protein HMPREF0758_1101 [Serratia odorifera DSM 4582]|uniref:Uncharacterized protein n=1 Tax=Serratia odorifera DSM 4582 TaxID=667129 RepID=D4DYV1_SEROD|nr:hypothetical protein HMPREF0758_1101 [Serratia odorifera DSM 4582]
MDSLSLCQRGHRLASYLSDQDGRVHAAPSDNPASPAVSDSAINAWFKALSINADH